MIQTNRMVLNAVANKSMQGLRYHPLMYFHWVRATEMPALEENADENYTKFANLHMEFNTLFSGCKSKEEAEAFDIEGFKDKVMAFVRSL